MGSLENLLDRISAASFENIGPAQGGISRQGFPQSSLSEESTHGIGLGVDRSCAQLECLGEDRRRSQDAKPSRSSIERDHHSLESIHSQWNQEAWSGSPADEGLHRGAQALLPSHTLAPADYNEIRSPPFGRTDDLDARDPVRLDRIGQVALAVPRFLWIARNAVSLNRQHAQLSPGALGKFLRQQSRMLARIGPVSGRKQPAQPGKSHCLFLHLERQ
jgi:hypothetical protein